MTTNYIVVGCYLALMLAVGVAFRRMNQSTDDYFRSGCRGTWWLIGSSAFMSAFSAYTFTGAASVAFESGWTVMAIFWGNALGFLFSFLFLARWFRQMRCVTSAQVVGQRFNDTTRYFYVAIGMVNGLLVSGLALYTLAIFSSVIFGLPLVGAILVLGMIMVAYSVLGGSWAVMGTDFLQTLILLPLTVLLAGVCLWHLGGVSGLFTAIEAAGLQETFRMVKSPGQFPADAFTLFWIAAMITKNVFNQTSMMEAVRYFSAKDGKAASRGALLACILFLVGSLIWFLPPITSRLLFAEEVLALPLAKPAEGAYAIASMNLLPVGLGAIMGVGIIAATMSSLDSGLNRNAAVVIYDVVPLFCKVTGRASPSPRALFLGGQAASLVFGTIIVGLAVYYSTVGGVGAFSIMINVNATLGIPLAIPMALGVLIRRTPAWAALFSAAVTLVFSLSVAAGLDWTFQARVFANFVVGSLSFAVTRWFWSTTSADYRQKLTEFFQRMTTPVDFEEEVGSANDHRQLRLLGKFAVTVGGLSSLLLFTTHSAADRWVLIAFVAIVLSLGGMMLAKSRT